MWIQTPGDINESLIFLGTAQNALYLLKGDPDILIGGGGPWMIPELQRQIDSRPIDMERVQYLFIGHTHFDHCGAVPYLQKKYPHLRILASRGAGHLLSMEKAVRNIRTFSEDVMARLGLPMEHEGIPLRFTGIRLHKTLQEGDRIDLGPVSLRAYETPGHSKCSMVLYEPDRQWLFPSDSLNFPTGNGHEFMITASESFVDYLAGLRKLMSLPVKICAWEHHGLVTGDRASGIVLEGIRYTVRFREQLLEKLEHSGDAEAVAEWMARDWILRSGFDFLTYEVMLYISRRMVQNAVQEDIGNWNLGDGRGSRTSPNPEP